ncbi:MAG: HTTM domain-containing protein [Flavobacteriaceae bacterium]|jgi:hypothetical protein|nr:HTTM domain-containing protein [Flavobacteriaceae bacterium]
MKNKALQYIDNSPLILFRILLGFLLACEAFGALMTGWVRENLVDVRMTFSHIHMDFLQNLVGPQMYAYFALMGLAGIGVMLGYRYRLSMILYTILWSGAYFIQKTSYNNHYYMLLIICIYMCFLPANRYASLDLRSGRVKEELVMPQYYSWIFIFQVSLLYLYGTLAKLYPDWLDGTFVSIMYSNANIPASLQELFSTKMFSIAISYLGIMFDGLVVFLLFFRRTRTIGVIASLIFHLFNSFTLQIGIFPYFALSFAAFFYAPEQIRARFFKRKPQVVTDDAIEPKEVFKLSQFSLVFLGVLMFVQLVLPLRHYFIKGDVLWTEEGHRLSWRMMLRSRGGYISYKVIDKKTQEQLNYPLEEVLSNKQLNRLNTPDMIWQMAQVIKKDFAKKGKEVAVYADSYISINGRDYSQFVDPEVDLASVKWNYFTHCDWILDKPF